MEAADGALGLSLYDSAGDSEVPAANCGSDYGIFIETHIREEKS
jgi:hypothetical protein